MTVPHRLLVTGLLVSALLPGPGASAAPPSDRPLRPDDGRLMSDGSLCFFIKGTSTCTSFRDTLLPDSSVTTADGCTTTWRRVEHVFEAEQRRGQPHASGRVRHQFTDTSVLSTQGTTKCVLQQVSYPSSITTTDGVRLVPRGQYEATFSFWGLQPGAAVDGWSTFTATDGTTSTVRTTSSFPVDPRGAWRLGWRVDCARTTSVRMTITDGVGHRDLTAYAADAPTCAS